MRKIIYSLILLTLLFGAFSALAQDSDLPSPGILPDSPFYFLKAWKEAIQNFFTFGAENKAKQFLHLADVRLAEYQKMIEKGKTDIAQKTLDKYQKQLDHALQKIEELKNKGEDTTGISQKAEDTVNKHIEVLQRNLEKAPEAAQKGLQNAIENSSKVIEKTGGKTKKEKSCLNSGGTLTIASCCQTTSDFPNTCLIGACGCSPDNSHEVKTCDCGSDKCFNGEKCISILEVLSEEPNETKFDEYLTKAWLGKIPAGQQFDPSKIVKAKSFITSDQLCTSIDIKKDINAGQLSTAFYDRVNNDYIQQKSAFPQSLKAGNTTGCMGITFPAGKYEEKIYIDDILVAVLPFEIH
jgi:hypothetical protein